MKVRLHEVEDKVDVPVVLGFHEVLQLDDVGVRLRRLQCHEVHDFAEGALSVGRVLEGVKVLLESVHEAFSIVCPVPGAGLSEGATSEARGEFTH